MILKSCLAALAVGICCASFANVAGAQETRNYTYDALGRLTKVEVTGGDASGTEVAYKYDSAGNRDTMSVTGSPNGSGSGGGTGAGVSAGSTVYVIVPLNGFTLITLAE